MNCFTCDFPAIVAYVISIFFAKKDVVFASENFVYKMMKFTHYDKLRFLIIE